MKRVLRPRSLGMLVLALVLAAAVYGFAAANIVPASSVGDGSGAISGYTISGIVYTLNSDGNPADIDAVGFTLSATATSAYVSFDGGTSWTSCAIAGGTSVSCTGLNESVASANTLRVVSAN